jgi:hypothetical protein
MRTDKDFFEWSQTATKEEQELLDRIFAYEKLYFEDMTFKPDSICHGFLCTCEQDKSGNWIEVPYDLGFDLLHTKCIVKIESQGCFGQYDPKEHIITISPEQQNNVQVIVHEMIHAYEDTLLRLGKTSPLHLNLRDILTFSFYNNLTNKTKDLNDKIKDHAHIFTQEDISDTGGYHSILFFLKSLDLDLRLGLKPGTVCGYRECYQILNDTGEEI